MLQGNGKGYLKGATQGQPEMGSGAQHRHENYSREHTVCHLHLWNDRVSALIHRIIDSERMEDRGNDNK